MSPRAWNIFWPAVMSSVVNRVSPLAVTTLAG